MFAYLIYTNENAAFTRMTMNKVLRKPTNSKRANQKCVAKKS